MVRSPRSRGKGNRCFPGRPGGVCPKKPAIWRNRGQHLVATAEELSPPRATLCYFGVFGENATHNIYLLDQRMARMGIPYLAQYHCTRWNRTQFTIVVSAEHAGRVAQAIANIHALSRYSF